MPDPSTKSRKTEAARAQPVRILGIDPGSRHTGYACVERRGSRLVSLVHGRLSPPRDAPLERRLVVLADGLRDLVETHRPEVAVLESLFRGVNPRSLIVLAQARGALLLTLASCGVPIAEYTPAEIKTALTGNGRADKQQVARMVSLILGLGPKPLPADASDALAVAICYSQRRRVDRLAGRRGVPRDVVDPP